MSLVLLIAIIFIGYVTEIIASTAHNQYDPTLHEKKATRKDSISDTVLKLVHKARGKGKLSRSQTEDAPVHPDVSAAGAGSSYQGNLRTCGAASLHRPNFTSYFLTGT